MADWHVYSRRSSRRSDEDFEEADVWSVVVHDSDDSISNPKISSGSSSSTNPWRLPTAPKMIARTAAATISPQKAKVIQQASAPMNIPDWSKIYGGNSTMGSWDDHHGDHHCHENDEEEFFDDMVPPHEWLARKLARSQISSSSVCEGIGRTLKGRDLSKVRNAILTKTGFLE